MAVSKVIEKTVVVGSRDGIAGREGLKEDHVGKWGIRRLLTRAPGIDEVISIARTQKDAPEIVVGLLSSWNGMVRTHAHTALLRMTRSSDVELRQSALLAVNSGLIGKNEKVISGCADLMSIAIRNPDIRDTALSMVTVALLTGNDFAKLKLLEDLRRVCRRMEFPQELVSAIETAKTSKNLEVGTTAAGVIRAIEAFKLVREMAKTATDAPQT